MKIFKSKYKLQKEILNDQNISFVPTMGGLHKGHVSLVRKAKQFKGKSLVSIFVNPKQFNNKHDYKTYPRNVKKDLKILKSLKVDYIYLPIKKEIFTFKTNKKIYLHKYSKKLCGKFRKCHFEGVLNVINRFLEIIKPKRIFLGEKDFQQLFLIREHILKRNIKTKVIACRIVREPNGIASSTRNSNLNKDQIKIASKIFKFLKSIKKKSVFEDKSILKKILELGASKVDYIKLINLKTLKSLKKINKKTRIFISYYLDKTRLIDNV